MSTPDDRLFLTGNEDADRLLAAEPLALLIGFALDQQVSVQKAFSGPLVLRQRLGHLDAARIAAMDPAELDQVFRERPALHRFPGAMASKVGQLCRVVAETYGNDAARIWSAARDGRDLQARLLALPGFGEMKVRGVTAILAKRLGLTLP
ncbi:MAG: HhH-GPD-type base excision DNA repair protein, partial [Chloroflexota bacterium]